MSTATKYMVWAGVAICIILLAYLYFSGQSNPEQDYQKLNSVPDTGNPVFCKFVLNLRQNPFTFLILGGVGLTAIIFWVKEQSPSARLIWCGLLFVAFIVFAVSANSVLLALNVTDGRCT